MTDTLEHIAGLPVLVCAADGPALRGEADALDLIVAAGHHGAGASWIALPASRLPDDFFQLHTGLAGMFLQKFVAYGLNLAILGDISRHTGASASLRDLVRESNRGRHAWFLSGIEELRGKLERARTT